MEQVWDIGKKLAFGGAVLVAVPVALPVVVPCLFVLSFAAAVLSVPVASTAVGYYALKKVLGFGKTRVLGWHSDTDRDEIQGTFDQHEARGPKVVEELMPPSSAVYVPSPGECEIVPVSQEPITYHQHDEGYDDQEMVEGSAQVGLCAPPCASHPQDAEWEQIGAEGGPEVCEEKAAAAAEVILREQPQLNAFVGSPQNVEGGEYQQDELVDKQEADEAQKESEEAANQEAIYEDQKRAGQTERVAEAVDADAKGDKPQQVDQQAETLSAAEQENGSDNHLVQTLEPEFDHIHDDDMERKLARAGVSKQKPDVVHEDDKGDLVGTHDAGKKRLASEVASVPSQGEEKVPREENMHMHPEQFPEEGGERLLEQSESPLSEAEVKEPGADQLKPEAEEKDLGVPREDIHPEQVPEEVGERSLVQSESLVSEAEEKEPDQLKPEAEEKDLGVPREEYMKMHPEQVPEEGLEQSEFPACEAEEKEPEAEQLKLEAEEKRPGAEQPKPEPEEKAPGAEQLKPELEEKEPRAEQPEAGEEPLPKPETEQLKPLLAPEAEADGGAPDDKNGLVQGSEPEAYYIHDDDREPLLERTVVSEQKPVDREPEAGADMQQTQHGIYDGVSEQPVVVEPEEDHHHDGQEPVVDHHHDVQEPVVVEHEEDHHHDGQEPVVVELEDPEPAGVESEAGGGNRSEHDATVYHRLDGASSMDEYGSVAEEFPEEGVSSSDEGASRRFHSQELSRTSSARSEDCLLREILTVQKVVGYMDDLRESPADEVERLYDFLGVEMPPAYEKTTDPRKLLESLDLLKAIVGVK